MPNNDRVMIQPDPPEERTSGGLYIPEKAQQWSVKGTILHGGLTARDLMYDHGHQVGDRVQFGQLAGVWLEWDHITELGIKLDCIHDWVSAPCHVPRVQKKKCHECGAVRTQEPVLVMNVEDILLNETAEERIRSSEFKIARGKSADGKTTHVIVRETSATMNHTAKEIHVIAQ
jgi:co-chaperonin GroES (HSP10)